MTGFRDFWVRAALMLALLLPVYFLVAALGTKFHLLDWRVGFGLMTYQLGGKIMAGVAALALIGLLLAIFTPPRRGIGASLLALLIPLLGIGYGLYVAKQAQAIPPIHDITTDAFDPPGFSEAVQSARAAVPGVNSLDLASKRDGDGRPFTDVQAASYPDIASIPTGLAPARAFDEALTLARAQHWRLGRTDAAAGIIEASAETFWYGFVDDVVVRVRPDGAGARIDMRSVSRVGRSDLGANAARMRPYLAALRARVREIEAASPPPPLPEEPAADAPAP